MELNVLRSKRTWKWQQYIQHFWLCPYRKWWQKNHAIYLLHFEVQESKFPTKFTSLANKKAFFQPVQHETDIFFSLNVKIPIKFHPKKLKLCQRDLYLMHTKITAFFSKKVINIKVTKYYMLFWQQQEGG